MKAHYTLPLLGIVCVLLLAPGGCARSHITDDCKIRGEVRDAVSGVPVDSAKIYVSYVAVSYADEDTRFFACVADENGTFSSFCSCHGFHIVEVEKDGYLSPPAAIVQGGGEVYFSMVPDTLSG